MAIAERNPFFIILDDFYNKQIYWILVTKEKVVKTSKEFKIVIPYENLLTIDTKALFENILVNYPFERGNKSVLSNDNDIVPLEIEAVEDIPFNLKIIYKLDVRKGLICSLKEKRKKVDIVLGYFPGSNGWDKEKNKLSWEDPYYYTLYDLNRYIKNKYISLKQKKYMDILESMCEEIEGIVKEEGIRKLAEVMFDWKNIGKEVYKYRDFIRAFEQYSGLKEEQYKARAIGGKIEFITEDKEYVIDTYEGKTWELKTYIENESYDEIYTMTNENFWSDIYLDAGIEKIDFIPRMLSQWESYWDDLYRRIRKEVGHTKHLDEMKEKSWREFQIFDSGYEDVGDIIHYAWELNEMELYPMAVLTMMNIFDRDCCYEEYCEYEFNRINWEPIYLDESDDNLKDDTKYFYIQELRR